PMVSGYHFLPVAPASWRKTTPAAAVTSVNWSATGGGGGGATAVTCGAGLEDSWGFWESLHAPTNRALHTTLPTSPRRAILLRCRAITPRPFYTYPPRSSRWAFQRAIRCGSSPRTLTNCLDGGSERVDKSGHLCSDG